MADDIVTRLVEEASRNKHRGTPLGFAAMDAANEITRLRAIVAMQKDELYGNGFPEVKPTFPISTVTESGKPLEKRYR